MKKILLLGSLVLSVGIFVGCETISTISEKINDAPKQSKKVKLQEKFLFKELIDNGLYLGIPKEDFLQLRPNAEYNPDAYDFRSIYVDENFSERFMNIIYYFDKDNNEPLYEFILILNPALDANAMANEHFGLPNYKDKEWRFPPAETNLPYTIAVWTFKNKIIIAATLPETEWENGIE